VADREDVAKPQETRATTLVGPPPLLAHVDMRPHIALAVYGPLLSMDLSEAVGIRGTGRYAKHGPAGGEMIVRGRTFISRSPGARRTTWIYALNEAHECHGEILSLLRKMAQRWPPLPIESRFHGDLPPMIPLRETAFFCGMSKARFTMLTRLRAAGTVESMHLYSFCGVKSGLGRQTFSALEALGIVERLRLPRGIHKSHVRLNPAFVAHAELNALLDRINENQALAGRHRSIHRRS
jgi:hypothetical protein